MRFILGFIGAVFAGVLLISMISNLATYVQNPPAPLASEEFHKEPKALHLASDGLFGKFDNRAAAARLPGLFGGLLGLPQPEAGVVPRPQGHRLQRCRDQEDRVRLEDPGAVDQPGHRRAGDAQGAAVRHLPGAVRERGRGARGEQQCASARPLADDQGARGRRGLRLFAAHRLHRTEQVPDEHWQAVPAEAKPPQGLHFNPYFANLNIAMPPPLTSDGQVTYADGTKPTVDQMAKDVSAFLVWTAEPNLESRRAAGFAVAIFLLIASDPRLFRLSAGVARCEAGGAGDRRARSREPGEEPPREGQARRRRLGAARGQLIGRSLGEARTTVGNSVVMETRIMRVPRLRSRCVGGGQRYRPQRLRLRHVWRSRTATAASRSGRLRLWRLRLRLAVRRRLWLWLSLRRHMAMATAAMIRSAGTAIIIIRAAASTCTTAIARATSGTTPSGDIGRPRSLAAPTVTTADRRQLERLGSTALADRGLPAGTTTTIG